MKRSLTFVLFLWCCIALSAQLTRTVYGISLGEKESNVVQRMVDKKLTIETEDSQHGKLISGKGDVIFAGEAWDGVSVSIRNGKVYGILFLKEKEYEEGRELIQTFSSLILSLAEKYPDYAQEPKSKKYSYGMDTSVLFKDDKTTIVLTEKLRPESTSSITLGYVDNVEFDAHGNEAAKEL
ncbi:MAG: hypothetical protein UH084_04755 [Paludibacteraceae bacterium]|nr:hypothetical protein [Paludibacteraceae bacterium]